MHHHHHHHHHHNNHNLSNLNSLSADWFYLILLYVLMMVVRFFILFLFLPVLSRIGIQLHTYMHTCVCIHIIERSFVAINTVHILQCGGMQADSLIYPTYIYTYLIIHIYIHYSGHKCTFNEAIFMSWAGLRGVCIIKFNIIISLIVVVVEVELFVSACIISDGSGSKGSIFSKRITVLVAVL